MNDNTKEELDDNLDNSENLLDNITNEESNNEKSNNDTTTEDPNNITNEDPNNITTEDPNNITTEESNNTTNEDPNNITNEESNNTTNEESNNTTNEESNDSTNEEPDPNNNITNDITNIDDTTNEEPTNEEPTYDQSTYDQSTYDQSTYDQSTYDQSSYDQSPDEQPTEEQPTDEDIKKSKLTSTIKKIALGFGIAILCIFLIIVVLHIIRQIVFNNSINKGGATIGFGQIDTSKCLYGVTNIKGVNCALKKCVAPQVNTTYGTCVNPSVKCSNPLSENKYFIGVNKNGTNCKLNCGNNIVNSQWPANVNSQLAYQSVWTNTKSGQCRTKCTPAKDGYHCIETTCRQHRAKPPLTSIGNTDAGKCNWANCYSGKTKDNQMCNATCPEPLNKGLNISTIYSHAINGVCNTIKAGCNHVSTIKVNGKAYYTCKPKCRYPGVSNAVAKCNTVNGIQTSCKYVCSSNKCSYGHVTIGTGEDKTKKCNKKCTLNGNTNYKSQYCQQLNNPESRNACIAAASKLSVNTAAGECRKISAACPNVPAGAGGSIYGHPVGAYFYNQNHHGCNGGMCYRHKGNIICSPNEIKINADNNGNFGVCYGGPNSSGSCIGILKDCYKGVNNNGTGCNDTCTNYQNNNLNPPKPDWINTVGGRCVTQCNYAPPYVHGIPNTAGIKRASPDYCYKQCNNYEISTNTTKGECVSKCSIGRSINGKHCKTANCSQMVKGPDIHGHYKDNGQAAMGSIFINGSCRHCNSGVNRVGTKCNETCGDQQGEKNGAKLVCQSWTDGGNCVGGAVRGGGCRPYNSRATSGVYWNNKTVAGKRTVHHMYKHDNNAGDKYNYFIGGAKCGWGTTNQQNCANCDTPWPTRLHSGVSNLCK